MERLSHRPRPHRPDPGHSAPLFRSRGHDGPDGSKPLEECSGVLRRESWDCCKHGLGARHLGQSRALSVGRAISLSSALSASCKIEEPSGRIRRGGGKNDRDSLIEYGENASTECCLAVWVVGDRSLEQEHRKRASTAQPSDLAPEPPTRDRDREIGYRLSLDQSSMADLVVSDSERRERDGGPGPHELVRNAAALLEHVNEERRTLRHAARVADRCCLPKVAFLASSGMEEA